MRKRSTLMMLACVPFLAAASCQTAALTDPCDVLVAIDPLPSSNAYLVVNDRSTAVAIAQHRGRYQKYRCKD